MTFAELSINLVNSMTFSYLESGFWKFSNFRFSITVGTLSMGDQGVGVGVALTLEHCHAARDEKLERSAGGLKKDLDVTASSHLIALLHLLSATGEVPRCAHLKVATWKDGVQT